MAFTCATPLSSRAPPFVPRRLASPFEASNCRQDSDCGSSSGLGGMKAQELASDEGGSSSSGAPVQAPPFYQRPQMPPGPMPCMAPIPLPLGGLPSWVHPTPPGASNDLFVHIQMGETLSMVVGNDVQNIHGPATVRMVGESGISPSALPIHVPPGHMIHQIVDEQGILRHLILSPEPPARHPPPAPTPSSGCSHLASSPMPPYNSNFYTVDRKWSGTTSSYRHDNSNNGTESAEADFDSEENERVREMLSRICTPQVIRVTPYEADLAWQELDTSEAAAPGGPFPQLDASEFIYHIVLFESQGRFVHSYRCEPEAGNKMRLCSLRPGTDYYVQLKASLEERGLVGEPSEPVSFRTAPARPESPYMPRVLAKGCDWAHIGWRSPPDNGAPIIVYCVYVAKPGETLEKSWEGKTCDARITNLRPQTTYNVRVTAVNRIGESVESQNLIVNTRSDSSLPPPPAPTILTLNPRSLKLALPTSPSDVWYLVEQYDAFNDSYSIVRDRTNSSTVFINELVPGHEYRFRIATITTDSSEYPRSEWLQVKMPIKNERNNFQDRLITPQKPFIICQNRQKIEIGWKCPGAKEKEFSYHLEGSSFNQPNRYRTLYRGPLCVFLLTDDDVQNVRVQAVNKRGAVTEFSEVLVLPKIEEEVIPKPPQPSAPTLEPAGRGLVKIAWHASQVSIPSTASYVYEVRRIGAKNLIIYTGTETSCALEGLGNRETVEIQVRVVVVTRDGMRVEGDWSPATTGTSMRDPPPQPRDLKVASDITFITWTPPEASPDLSYRVHCCELQDGKIIEERVHETTECKHPLSKLNYAGNYTCRVIAFHDGGESEPSDEISFVTPPGVPAQPEAVTLTAQSMDTLLLKWSTPDSRGDAIQQYRIVVESHDETIRDFLIPAPAHECHIEDLEAETVYRVEISARNSVGTGVSAASTARTKRPPPPPPVMFADIEFNQIRLRWKPHDVQHLLLYKYRLVRLNENDTMSTLYEGDLSTFKMRGLNENTIYRFQIRATDRDTGPGPWSEVYSYKTSLAPPPAVKSPPTAMPCGHGHSQIEWTPVLPKPNTKKFFYRLQAVDCSLEYARWHTVYEGPMSSYTLRTSDYPSAVQARILCVRPGEGDSDEILGTPSPVVYIANQSLGRRIDDPSDLEHDSSRKKWYSQRPTWWPLSDRQFFIMMISLLFFAIMSCLTAFLSNSLFTLSVSNPSSSERPYSAPEREL